MIDKKKIYVFGNGSNSLGLMAIAVSEDGKTLAGHICSNDSFVRHDMGIDSNWKHNIYNEAYGEGNWELIYLSPGESLPECLLKLNKEVS